MFKKIVSISLFLLAVYAAISSAIKKGSSSLTQLQFNNCTYTYKEPIGTIEVSYPHLSYASPMNISDEPFNAYLDNYIDTLVTDFKKDALELPSEYGSQLAITHDVSIVYGRYVCIYLKVYTYHGGAHGLYATHTIVYDRCTFKRIELADLAVRPDYLEQLAHLARQGLEKNFKELRISRDPYTDPWVLEGTAPIQENYTSWAFTPEGLQLIFGIYQVAPYCYGEQIVVIHREALQNILQLPKP